MSCPGTGRETHRWGSTENSVTTGSRSEGHVGRSSQWSETHRYMHGSPDPWVTKDRASTEEEGRSVSWVARYSLVARDRVRRRLDPSFRLVTTRCSGSPWIACHSSRVFCMSPVRLFYSARPS